MTEKNDHGVPQFPKSDARRLFVLAAAIDKLDRPTLTTLSNYTSHNKGTIDADVRRLSIQYGMKIIKDGPVYAITSWGEILKLSGIRNILQG